MNRRAGPPFLFLACALSAAALPACVDDVDPLDSATQGAASASASGSGGSGNSSATSAGSSTGDATGGGTTGGGAGLSHAADIQPIWDAKCVSACHETGGAAATILLLTEGDAFAALVDAQSPSIPGLTLVVPGDRESSYLWHKVNGSQADVGGGGLKMPIGGSLDASDLETIGQWIDEGAKP